jgi:hypothetical protein
MAKFSEWDASADCIVPINGVFAFECMFVCVFVAFYRGRGSAQEQLNCWVLNCFLPYQWIKSFGGAVCFLFHNQPAIRSHCRTPNTAACIICLVDDV